MNKGIELPINILVIVAVAIIVLLGVIALFYSTWFKSTTPIDLNAATSRACNAVRGDCNVVTTNIVISPAYVNAAQLSSATLSALCINEFGIAAVTADFDDVCMNRVCGLNC